MYQPVSLNRIYALFKEKTMTRLTCTLTAITCVSLMATASQAATIGNSWDFGNDTGKDDLTGFTVSDPNTRFSFTSVDLVFTGAAHAGDSRRKGVIGVEVTDLSSAPSFTIQARGNPYTASGNLDFSDWEIHFLGAGAGSSDGNGNNGGVTFDGLVLLVESNGTSGTTWALESRAGAPGSGLGELTEENWSLGTGVIDFSITATWVGADLQLQATATNASNDTQTLNHTLTSFTPEGNWIGLGAYSRGPQTHTFDTFAVIPEPASLALLGLGGLLMLGRRRTA